MLLLSKRAREAGSLNGSCRERQRGRHGNDREGGPTCQRVDACWVTGHTQSSLISSSDGKTLGLEKHWMVELESCVIFFFH